MAGNGEMCFKKCMTVEHFPLKFTIIVLHSCSSPSIQQRRDGASRLLLPFGSAATRLLALTMKDLRALAHGVISPLYIIATVTIVMRIYVRGFGMRAFGWDDWAMASVLACLPDTDTISSPRVPRTLTMSFLPARYSIPANKRSCTFFCTSVLACNCATQPPPSRVAWKHG